MTEEEVNTVLVEMKLKGDELYEGGHIVMYRTDLYSSLAEAEKARGAVYGDECDSMSALHNTDYHAGLIQMLYKNKLPVRMFICNGEYTLPIDLANEMMSGFYD